MTTPPRPFDQTSAVQQEWLSFAFAAAGIGSWDYDTSTQQVWLDARCRELYGITDTGLVPYAQVMTYVHPDDQQRVGEAVAWSLNPQSGGHHDVQFRTSAAEPGVGRWLRCQGKAYFDHDGVACRFSGIVQDVTAEVTSRQAHQASETRFQNLVLSSPTATAVYVGRDMQIQLVNQPMLAIWGKDESVTGKTLHDALPELAGQPFLAQLQHVFDTGEGFYDPEGQARLRINGQWQTVWFSHAYRPLHNQDGTIYGVISTATDVTAQVQARQQLAQTQVVLQEAVELAQLGTWSWDAATNTVSADARSRQWYAYADGQSVAQAFNVVHPADQAATKAFIRRLLSQEHTGDRHQAIYRTINPQTGTEHTLRAAAKASFDAQGRLTRVLGIAQEVTEQVNSRRAIEENEARFRSLIEQAPVATCLFVGREMVVAVANEPMLQFWGKGTSALGKPLADAVPELVGQPFLTILAEVFQTGETYKAHAAPADLLVDGVLSTYYFDFTYKPLFDERGDVYAIIDMAIDVTTQVVTHQKLQQAEQSLRRAINLAQLGTFQVDLSSETVYCSERMCEWQGLPRENSLESTFLTVVPADVPQLRAAFAWSLNPASGGYFSAEYRVINSKTGQLRTLSATGQTEFDAQGNALSLLGASLDVTAQRELQQALEQQVQERTEELAMINEELAATVNELGASNDQYVAVNTSLQEVNDLLRRSNENLQQFAYVASHDLQEPLRKIQQFGDLLKARHIDSASDERLFLDRMQSAAARMSTLIKDLLSYSRISTRQENSTPVALSDVVDTVLNDLEVPITETGAQIDVDPLPTLLGDATQLGQLFQNLLSNALKFRRSDATGTLVAPHIQIRLRQVTAASLPPLIKPARQSPTYYRIDVMDNGIGFDDKYVDRIFQVFQRLHGKNQYAGTGIGLAICEKVVTNHGGAISATSKPGQGATFSIYLPA